MRLSTGQTDWLQFYWNRNIKPALCITIRLLRQYRNSTVCPNQIQINIDGLFFIKYSAVKITIANVVILVIYYEHLSIRSSPCHQHFFLYINYVWIWIFGYIQSGICTFIALADLIIIKIRILMMSDGDASLCCWVPEKFISTQIFFVLSCGNLFEHNTPAYTYILPLYILIIDRLM